MYLQRPLWIRQILPHLLQLIIGKVVLNKNLPGCQSALISFKLKSFQRLKKILFPLLPSLNIWRGSNNPCKVHLMQLGISRKAFIHNASCPSDRPVRNRLSSSAHIWYAHTVSQSSHLEGAWMGRKMSLVRKVICFLRGIRDHNWIFFKTAQSFSESQTAIILMIVSWLRLRVGLVKNGLLHRCLNVTLDSSDFAVKKINPAPKGCKQYIQKWKIMLWKKQEKATLVKKKCLKAYF